MNIKLVIFDCDGVLVDSEPLSAAVLMELMRENGLPIDWPVFRADFLGRSFATGAKCYQQRTGLSVPDDFSANYRERLLARMKGNLQPMPGILDVLQRMAIPFCLATSSSPQRLAVTMQETGLGPFFANKCFTASEVKHGKPAPDLVLHAAATMGAKGENCLVVEDTEIGLRGALAAKMQVWRFVGGTHLKDDASLPPDVAPHRVLDTMPALLDAFRNIGIAK